MRCQKLGQSVLMEDRTVWCGCLLKQKIKPAIKVVFLFVHGLNNPDIALFVSLFVLRGREREF